MNTDDDIVVPKECSSKEDIDMWNKYADAKFDKILQWGFDEDILTVEDCECYDYTPV